MNQYIQAYNGIPNGLDQLRIFCHSLKLTFDILKLTLSKKIKLGVFKGSFY